MAKRTGQAPRELQRLGKLPTGIQGFDELTVGGLPAGRISLVTGGPGSGKTLFGMQYLVYGAVECGEPGVFVAFEETTTELELNVASLGFDLKRLEARKLLALDHIPLERSEIEETGDYDLEGLFIRLNMAIDSIGAKRVVLDTIEALFAGFSNELILRAELRRLFRWLKDKGVTTIVTAEKGAGTLTRHSLEEYVSDCVIVLDHSVKDGTATRRLRVIKYRGSHHGTNDYPFLIGDRGISVLPITSVELNHPVSDERLSSGMPRLDAMFDGKGFFKGSSILVSGTAGTGKSSLAATFTDHICRSGGSVLYLAFEESRDQITRNMRSIGMDLEQWTKKGVLTFHNVRPTNYGLEMHLVLIHDLVRRLKPSLVVFDPISNLISVGNSSEVKSMLTRLIDFLKMEGVTTFFTNLLDDITRLEQTEVGVSSLMDTWIVLRDTEINGERNRVIHVIKSRGMPHSNQLREFLITARGLEITDVYVGRGQVYTGSARVMQEAEDLAGERRSRQDHDRLLRSSLRRRKAIEAQMAALQAELEEEEESARDETQHSAERDRAMATEYQQLMAMRKADHTLMSTNQHKKPERK